MISNQDRQAVMCFDEPRQPIEDRSERRSRSHRMFELMARSNRVNGPALEGGNREKIDEIAGYDEFEAFITAKRRWKSVNEIGQHPGTGHHLWFRPAQM